MPRVLDNIEIRLAEALRELLAVSHRADVCVGYLHLRGWNRLGDLVDRYPGGAGRQARVLVGMTQAPEHEQAAALRVSDNGFDGRKEARQRQTALVEAFQRQLTLGLPDTTSIAGLRLLARQLRERKVCVKLFLRHALHAKLYITYTDHPGAPVVAFVGSSNLTAPGLAEQGELNVDVADQDAAEKLRKWFDARWNDEFSQDISDELARIIEESWAREEPFSPYLVYLKIAYHLAQEALEAPREYRLPVEFESIILDFQRDAVLRLRRALRSDPDRPESGRIVLLGDVVGMGKTLTAAAVAKLYQNDEGGRCVVCCPPKLASMWRSYLQEYSIAGDVVPYSVTGKLQEQRGRCRLMVLDESHNLRNRETKAWSEIRDFIRDQDARVLLLSATPYNKHYEDLSSQLRLALDEKADLGVRPEAYFREQNEAQFVSRYQASPRSLTAFEHSASPDDWRDLMKRFLVRRTRGHIIQHSAQYDASKQRYYLTLRSGVRSYFPKRTPVTLPFPLDAANERDQYARLYNEAVVSVIAGLSLPRYGLGMYVDERIEAAGRDAELLSDLGKAGKRLLGYCKVNLFKRLESSGHCFLLSLERHILRNLVFVHAIDNGLDLPIGVQDSTVLDTATSDADADSQFQLAALDAEASLDDEEPDEEPQHLAAMATLQARAAAVYAQYMARQRNRRQFRWIASRYFTPQLRKGLLADAEALLRLLQSAGDWQSSEDAKLAALNELLTTTERKSKVLIFTQFADTAIYLQRELHRLGLRDVEAVTAASPNPADQVRRFSPASNRHTMLPGEKSVRVMVATEVLSEGQNCQDASVVVNYDLPWAIIRLIQRAGRVDRIGQENDEIRIYSCLPAQGVEKIIGLRTRLVGRLDQNREVIGTDERFFDDEQGTEADKVRNLYAGALDLDDPAADAEDVDIATFAQGIWQEAIGCTPALEKQVKALPDQVFATRHADTPEGALVYFKTADGYDSLLKVSPRGDVVTQSLLAILKAAECSPQEPALPAHPVHHEIVRKGIADAIRQVYSTEGALGPRNSARRRVYERLRCYRDDLRLHPDLFAIADHGPLDEALNDLSKHPLTERARDTLNRRLREGISDPDLAQVAIGLRENGLLSHVIPAGEPREPRLICSIGLFPREECVP